MKRTALFSAIMFVLLSNVLRAQPVGDNCSNAINLGAQTSPYSSTTTGLADDTQLSCLSSSPDRFFYIDVPAGQGLQIGQIWNNYDSKHLVAYGLPCPGSTEITCWDDGDYAITQWTNNTGATQRVWWIQDGYDGDYGEFELAWNLITPPANDICSNAIQVSCGQIVSGNTSLSGVDLVPICAPSTTVGYGVWYKITGNGNEITASLCESGFDAQIAVYSGNCNALNCLTGDDDWCCFACGGQVTFNSTAGVTYYIWVTGYDANTGPFTLSIDCEETLANDVTPTLLTSPVSSCSFPGLQQVQVQVKNLGAASQSNFPIFYSRNGQTPVQNTFSQTIAPGETKTHTFTPSISMGSGSHTFRVWTKLTGDQNVFNDTLVTTVQQLSFNANTYNATNAPICWGDYAYLYSSGGVQYQWSNGANTYYNYVNPATTTTYYVTVTGENPNCIDVDTLTVVVVPPPAQPNISGNSVLCSGSTVTLSSSITSNIVWYPTGQTTASITVSQGGYYYVRHINPASGCETWSEPFLVQVSYPACLEPNGDGVICSDETETLCVTCTSGLQWTYLWNTGATTSCINVSPDVTTSYAVTATNQYGCAFVLNETVQVSSDAPPGVPVNLLPPNGAANVPNPVVLSWSPAPNATLYQVFIWQGPTMPQNPYAVTSQVSYTLFNLVFGQSYNWSVRAVNACTGVISPNSATQSFTLVHLPDLVVENAPVPPDTAFSGTSIAVDWTIRNNTGLAATGNGGWFDALYLSFDNVLDVNDIYLGAFQRPNALAPNGSYANSGEVILPDGLTGDFCILVSTDAYNAQAEANEINNVSVCGGIHIRLTPPPDLRVSTISLSGVAGNTAFQGATIGVNFTVENQFNGANLSGMTIGGQWYDRVYISTENVFNPLNATALTYGIYHSGNLSVNDTYNQSISVNLPSYISGTYYIHACTDAWDDEFEYIFENNNCTSSQAINIIALPKPDFTVFDVAAPSQASNKESVVISWKGRNNGAAFNNYLVDEVLLNDAPNLTTPLASMGSLGEYRNLPNGNVVYNAQKSASIPDIPPGNYFIVVRTNTGGVQEDNLADNFAAVPIEIKTPNLTVTTVNNPATVQAGQTINLQWTIQNTGAGSLPNCPVSDRIRLYYDAAGVNPVPSFNSSFSGSLTLLPGNSAVRQQNITLPNGLANTVWVEIVTNYNNNAYEAGLTADNRRIGLQPIIVSLPDYPNLTPVEISPSAVIATAGNSLSVTYSVQNQGDGPILGNWSDALYLSSSPVLGQGQTWLLASSPQSQVVAADGGYDNTVSVTLPYWLPEGIYYLCLYTDAANGIFENDDENDNTACELIIINAVPDVDLAVTQAGVTGNATPGGVLTLQWRVENVGSTPTTNGVWRDAVYLSQDMLFTPSSDILVHQWQHDGSLQDGESYTRVENFTLPQGLAATPWFLFVVTDHDTATIDNDFSNNYLKVSQVGTGSTVIITFPPQPDLQVTNFAATPQGIAGQPINLSFTVKNEGPGAAPGVWSDVAILSTDLVAGNAGDIVVGQWQRTGPLPATGADNYTVHSQVVLPANASGNYILLLQTDYTATVGETNENNNVRDVSLFVTQALPADLIPYNVGAQAVDTIATDMTVTWKLQNAGINTISGYMQEGIYLSADTIWDTGDVLFATRNSFISLNPGSNASHQVTSRLEGLSRRDYFIFIKIDQLNNLPETDEDNNCAIGLAPVFVEVPELPYDSPTPAVMLLEKPIYYRLEVPALFSGETMRLTLSGDHEGAFNELYLRYGESPTRTTHDYFFNTPFDEDQEILVPALTSGRYYAMAYAVDGTTSQDVELHWKIIPFQLTSIVADNGGNTGNVTVQIEGAKFEPGMMVWLSDPALGDIMASNVSIVNSVKAFVTFPLNGVDIGVYDVKAKNNAGTEVALIDGFEVIAGTIGGNPLLTTCSIDNGQGVVILNALDPVTYELQHPPFARPNQVVTITLRFENTGTVDVPAPQRIFAGLNGFPLAPAPDNFDDNMAEIPLIFIEQEGPPDILRPGGVAVQTVYTKATQPQGSMLFKLF